jgi:hypothetical protein
MAGKRYSAESGVLRGKLRASVEKNKEQAKELSALKSEVGALSSLQTRSDAMEAEMKKQRGVFASIRIIHKRNRERVSE